MGTTSATGLGAVAVAPGGTPLEDTVPPPVRGASALAMRRTPQPGQRMNPPGSGGAVIGAWHRGHCMVARTSVTDTGSPAAASIA